MIGSKIALFGCPVDKVLETIGAIEIAENLPHPMIDGEWGKTAPTASAAYVIMEFGEEDIEKAIEVTKKAGLHYLYHPGPFENWGHFDLMRYPKRLPNCLIKPEYVRSHSMVWKEIGQLEWAITARYYLLKHGLTI